MFCSWGHCLIKFLIWNTLLIDVSPVSYRLEEILEPGKEFRVQKYFSSWQQAKHLHFSLQTLFFFPNIPPHSISLPFSPCFSPFPFPPPLLYFPFLPFLFLFPFFLPGKFEHLSYLPGSAGTMLLRFFEP